MIGPRRGTMALAEAIIDGDEAGRPDRIRAILATGVDPDDGGMAISQTPLMHVVRRGDATCVGILLDAGADADVDRPFVGSPLSDACVRRVGRPIVEALLAAGADPCRRHDGLPPLAWFCAGGRPWLSDDASTILPLVDVAPVEADATADGFDRSTLDRAVHGAGDLAAHLDGHPGVACRLRVAAWTWAGRQDDPPRIDDASRAWAAGLVVADPSARWAMRLLAACGAGA